MKVDVRQTESVVGNLRHHTSDTVFNFVTNHNRVGSFFDVNLESVNPITHGGSHRCSEEESNLNSFHATETLVTLESLGHNLVQRLLENEITVSHLMNIFTNINTKSFGLTKYFN